MTSPWRADFPIFQERPELHYLDASASAQRPTPVLDAIRRFHVHDTANVHRGIYRLSEDATEAFEDARRAVAGFLHAPTPDEVVFTSGTTFAMNLLAATWGRAHLHAGDEIILSILEHHAVVVPFTELARERGVVVRIVPLTGDGQLDLGQYEQLLSERTKLVCVTGMSNVTGTIVDLARIGRAAKKVGARVFVDGAQLACHAPIDVRELPIDALAFSGTKAYGDFGIGALWGTLDLLSDLPPFLTGGSMIRSVTWDAVTYEGAPARFEAGTPNVTGAVALGAGVRYLEKAWAAGGREHEHALLAELLDRFAEDPSVTVYGPALHPGRGPVVAFSVAGVHPHDLAQILDGHGVAVRAGHHCAMPLHAALGVPATTRASIGLWNDRSDLDALVDGIAEAKATFAR